MRWRLGCAGMRPRRGTGGGGRPLWTALASAEARLCAIPPPYRPAAGVPPTDWAFVAMGV